LGEQLPEWYTHLMPRPHLPWPPNPLSISTGATTITVVPWLDFGEALMHDVDGHSSNLASRKLGAWPPGSPTPLDIARFMRVLPVCH
jgi:hypothetical protein